MQWDTSSDAARRATLTRLHNLMMQHPGSAGTNNSLRDKTLQSIISALKMTPTSVFYDFGCGFGLPAFTAVLLHGVHHTYGVDFDEHAVDWAQRMASKFPAATRDRFDFQEQDILQIQRLPADVTHVYSFDKVMTPKVLKHIRRLLSQHKGWQYFASCFNDASGLDVMPDPVQISGPMKGSGEQKTMYVFRRAVAVPRRAAPVPAVVIPVAVPRRAAPVPAAVIPVALPRRAAAVPVAARSGTKVNGQCKRCRHRVGQRNCKRVVSCHKRCDQFCWQHSSNYVKGQGCR